MTALASTDVTITVSDKKIWSKYRRHEVTIAFGDGALTYPAGGVPMPAFSKFGFARFIQDFQFSDMGSADGFLHKWDKTNNKIRIWQGDNTNVAAAPAVELGAVAVAAKTLKGVVWGW